MESRPEARVLPVLLWTATALAGLLVGCGDTLPGAVTDGAQETGGLADAGPADGAVPDAPRPDAVPPPAISGITEEGDDGVAVVGERIGLQGSSFGPSCAVSFGSVPARVISASSVDLQLQVPEGIDVGPHSPTLSCAGGQTSFDLTVRRYHLVSAPALDKLAVLEELSPGTITDSTARIGFKAADEVVLSHDSAVAYVASSTTATSAPAVGIVDLVAAGGPALRAAGLPHAEPVKLPVFGLAAAADAPVLAVAGGLYVVLYDTTDPRQPVRAGSIQLYGLKPGTTLPEISAGFYIAAALTPDGRTAVLLDGAADELSVHDISTPAAPVLLKDKIKVSAGTSAATSITLPLPFSGLLLKHLKLKGGSAQDLALSADGKQAIVLSGGGVGALLPESYNLDLHNSAISVVDLATGVYVNKLQLLPEAHVPVGVAHAPGGTAYVCSMSSSSAVLIQILFSLGVSALVGGGLDLSTIGSLLFKSFKDVIDVVKAAWQGTLFHLGGLHRVVGGKVPAAAAGFTQYPYLQGGACATFDGARLLTASQGWKVDIRFGGLTLIESFTFEYNLGATVHDLTAGTYAYHSLFPWQVKLLLPPWSFGHAACQQ